MDGNIQQLVEALIKEPGESEWLKYKKDNADAEMIGKDISALANGALVSQHSHAYMLWGIDDKSHAITGTNFSPYQKSQGNQELLSWLHEMLSDNVEFYFEETSVLGLKIVVLTIMPAVQYPVTFKKEPYIRVGSYTKRLATEPKLQVQLWNSLRNEKFELSAAARDLSAEMVDQRLDILTYFQKLGQKVPDSLKERLKYLEIEQIIRQQENGLFSISNFGALLLAKDFRDFPSIRRKEVRVVQYRDAGRTEIIRSRSFEQGYAVCFGELLTYIDALLPSSEFIAATGERRVQRTYPPEVVRELITNALMHQDLNSKGDCVLCEIFENRVEITNPGTLLIDKDRIVDLPPKSRNELLAGLMRHMHLCEELGMGWDKVVELCENAQLPSPSIIQYPDRATRIVLYSHIDFFEMTNEQKLWACYLHTCLLAMKNQSATNATLRDRFGLGSKSASSVSRLLRDAVTQGLIKLKDDAVGTKAKRYVPYWA